MKTSLFLILQERKNQRKILVRQQTFEVAENQQELFQRLKMETPNYYQSKIIFVGNLKFTIDNERLRREFAPFGTIISAEVIRTNNRSRGFGFVHFSSFREANNAVFEMNGRVVCGRPLKVTIARSREDNVRRLGSFHPRTTNFYLNQSIYFQQRRLVDSILIYIVPSRECTHDLLQIDSDTFISVCLTPYDHFKIIVVVL